MEDLARPIKFQSTSGTTVTKSDIAYYAVKTLYLIPIMAFAIVMILAFLSSESEKIEIPLWITLVMNTLFVATIVIRKIRGESNKLESYPTITYLIWTAELYWVCVLSTTLIKLIFQ